MRKSILIVADLDHEYLDYLVRFFRSSEFQHKYTLRTFTDRKKLESFLLDKKTAILLSHPNLLPQDESLIHSSICIQLLETKTSFETAELFSIYKYQPFRQLFQNISDLIQYRNQYSIDQSSSHKTKIISIFSPVGGVGKTTIALNLAKLLGENDHRVFYLNNEVLSSVFSLFAKEEHDPFSRLIYQLYVQSEKVNLTLERTLRFEPVYKFYYFPPLHNSMELQDLSEKLTEKLISLLVQSERFDYILIDLEASYHERIQCSLRISQIIFWVLTNEWHSREKNQIWTDILQNKNPQLYQSLLAITYFVVNKHTGEAVPKESDINAAVNMFLPYIPEWKHTNDIHSVFTSSIYRQELYKLFSRIKNESDSK